MSGWTMPDIRKAFPSPVRDFIEPYESVAVHPTFTLRA
jgi:hypothetical protein